MRRRGLSLSEFAKMRGVLQVPLSAAAGLLGVTRKTVRKHLPVVVLGPRKEFVRLSDIEAFQTSRTLKPQSSPL